MFDMKQNRRSHKQWSTPWEVHSFLFSEAYVAGFLDGDGSVVATVTRQSERYRFPWRMYLRINFTQHIRHKAMLENLQEFLNGYGHIRMIKSHHLAELVIQDRGQVKAVLERLIPHLILKKGQARRALAIIAIYEASFKSKNGKSFLSEKQRNEVFALIQEIRNLNSRTGGKRLKELCNPVTTSPENGGSQEM